MKFLIDAHLPKTLAEFFPEHKIVHTSQLETGNQTKDRILNTLSVLGEWVLITKDSDFYYSYIASRRPYKLILVKLGNMRLAGLKDYFSRNASLIMELIANHSFLIPEAEKVRVLE